MSTEDLKDDKDLDRGDDFEPKDDSIIDDDKKEELDKVIEGDADDKKDDDADEKDDKKADPAEKDDKKADKKDDQDEKRRIRIPKWRADEMIARERERAEAIERELAAERARNQKTGDDDATKAVKALEARVDALDEQYEKALLDGKPDDVARIRKEKRTAERELVRAEAETLTEARSSRATALAVEQVKYDAVLARIEDDHPELNEDSPDYDKALAFEVSSLMRALSPQKGMARALQDAVKYVMGPRKTAGSKEELDKLDDAVNRRKEREEKARRAAADANKKQPADTSKTGDDSDKHDDPTRGKSIFAMSQDEFAKLPEKDLAKLRGDAL